VVTTLEDDKAELITKAAAVARHSKGTGGPPHDQVEDLLRAYYRHVAPEDVVERSPEDLYGALASQYGLAAARPQGTAAVRVVTPGLVESGWSAGGHSVVEVVTDDMPFLVDSVTMELTRREHNVHVVIHPRFEVTRDITGALQRVGAVEDGVIEESAPNAIDESWMHVEIDRAVDEGEVAEIEESLQRVLRDVRESVEDWGKMQGQARAIVQELEEDPPPLSEEEIAEGREFMTWLSDDHFTFLGYREYRLETVGDADDEWALRALPGTGLGILRADQDMSGSFGKLPPLVRSKAREKTLLVLAKANSRATVHRPVYLDYVGVKTFDAQGEVVGERRFLGLFSSAAYTESVNRIPLLREKPADVLRRVGFDPRSHAG
jgi:glutamate dehydrogenase